LSVGINTIEVQSIDNVSNPSLLASVNVTYDASDPTVAISMPSANSTRTNVASINATGTATDDLGVARVEVRLNGGNWSIAEGTSRWSAGLTLANGSNLVEARAVDTAGRVSSLVSVSVTFNATLPPVNPPTNGNGNADLILLTLLILIVTVVVAVIGYAQLRRTPRK
jgi:hypothetical protein